MDGILLFNKPIGWTSHDAVDFVRRRTGQRSVGHAGTLDPMATGLLILLIGKATKLSGELMGLEKDYEGTMQLGLETDTQDLEGCIVSTSDWRAVTEDAVRAVFLGLTGTQAQAPPAYSAVKKGGHKLYDLARKGIAVTVEPRQIVVSRFDALAMNGQEVHFTVTCSKGTYIRSLASSVGERLGCGATLSSLVRTRIGPYRLSSALREEEVLSQSHEALQSRLVRKDPS